MSKRETLIHFFYKGKEVAKAKRIIENGLITYKYYNPSTKRWVKFQTFYEESRLPRNVLEKIKTNYYPTYSEDVFNANADVTVLLDYKPAIVLAPYDKLLESIRINEYARADVLLKEEHYPLIAITDVNVEYDELGKAIRGAYVAAQKLFKKMHGEFIESLNKTMWALKEIVEKTGEEAVIEVLEPTIEEPKWYIDVALGEKASKEIKNYPDLKKVVRVFKDKNEINKMRRTITIKKGGEVC